MDKYYVYELAYPESMGGAVFYVGKGKGSRINHHEQETKRGKKSAKGDVIRSIWNAGEKVAKKKIREGLSEYEAFQLEHKTIGKYKDLTNVMLTPYAITSEEN